MKNFPSQELGLDPLLVIEIMEFEVTRPQECYLHRETKC